MGCGMVVLRFVLGIVLGFGLRDRDSSLESSSDSISQKERDGLYQLDQGGRYLCRSSFCISAVRSVTLTIKVSTDSVDALTISSWILFNLSIHYNSSRRNSCCRSVELVDSLTNSALTLFNLSTWHYSFS
jgi:hypothetical protein